MTNAESYLRAAERIDGNGGFLSDVLRFAQLARLLDNINPVDTGELWTRETRVLALCFMSAMEEE